jgi:L-ribulokinase
VTDRCAVGVDHGTISGRAVVVKVSELGTALPEYGHCVMDAVPTAGPDRVELGPDWALLVPQDYVDVLPEDVARTVHIALRRGPVDPIGPPATDLLFARYQNVYGQASDDRRPPVQKELA